VWAPEGGREEEEEDATEVDEGGALVMPMAAES
jgi:hypothetical protein